VSKSDLSIKCSKEQRVLTISGSRSTPTSTQDYRQQQRPFGAFERSWPLPVDADAAGVSAKVSDGVLLLTVKRLQKQDDEGEDIFIN
jgi:HSP20 family protein